MTAPFLGQVSLGGGGGGYLGEVSVVGGIVPTVLPVGIPISGGSAGAVLVESVGGLLSFVVSPVAGKYLRSNGLGVPPIWSTLELPNTAAQGDLFAANSANVMSSIVAVAAGSVLISSGLSTLPAWSTSPSFLTWQSLVANGPSAVAHIIDGLAFSTAGTKLLSVRNNGVEKTAIDKDGIITGTGAGTGPKMQSNSGNGVFATNDTLGTTVLYSTTGFTIGGGQITGNGVCFMGTNGGLFTVTGAGGGGFGGLAKKVGCSFSTLCTPVSNAAGGGETDLITVTSNPAILARLGDSYRIVSSGVFDATAENKRIRMYFGGQLIFDSGALAFVSSAWKIDAVITRLGASNAEDVNVTWQCSDALLPFKYTQTTLAVDLTNNCQIKCTGAANTAASITETKQLVYYDPSPI